MKRIVILHFLLVGLFITGCATRGYVDKKIQALWDDLYSSAKFGTALPIRVWREASIDKDTNGKISLEELKKYLEGMYATQLKPMDTNADGKISMQEYVKYKNSGSMLLINKDMDVNGDGQISKEEFDGFNEDIFSEYLKMYDMNSDGQISKEEFYRYNEVLFVKNDLNKDGYLDKSEVVKKTDVTPRVMPEWKKVAPIICGPSCVWVFDWGQIGTDTGERPAGYCEDHPEAGWCPSNSHPGCSNNDVWTGNCVCYWLGSCTPFFD